MRNFIRIVFVLSFIVVNIGLLVPVVSPLFLFWDTALFTLIPGAVVVLICFALLLTRVGTNGGLRARPSQLWMIALIWSLLVGGIVTYTSTINYDYLPHLHYYGVRIGWTTLVFAGVSLLGLIISLALRKKVPDGV